MSLGGDVLERGQWGETLEQVGSRACEGLIQVGSRACEGVWGPGDFDPEKQACCKELFCSLHSWLFDRFETKTAFPS